MTRPDLTRHAKVAVWGDLHIGVHDDRAIRTLVECFEREGVTGVVANGDVHDCAAVSSHAGKARRAVVTSGQLEDEAASGRWVVDWMATRECWYGVGNHEDWINDVALATGTIGTFTVAAALRLPEGPNFHVLPHGYQIRAGSLVIEHGDVALGRGSGASNLARRLLLKYPNQTTLVNHFHHDDYAVHSTPDHAGVPRAHAAHGLGHLSDPTAHQEYAGRFPNWQQGAAIVRFWADQDGKSRFTVDHILIHRDRRNRPVFEYGGRVYRG